MKEKRVLMLGVYNIEDYSRGRILYKGLKANNVKTSIFLARNKNKYLKIFKRILRKDFEILLVTGKFVLVLSWLLKFLHKKKIIFDAFISDYDNLVNDRKLIKKNSLKAKLLWLGDKYSCKLADKTILDTKEHINYFVREFKSNKNKFKEIYIGADEEIFKPIKIKKDKKNFIVSFHGCFIPLQGIEYIIKSAKLLEKDKEIKFEIIGAGQTFKEMTNLSKNLNITNIDFLGFIEINKLPKIIARGDVCLGIFGNTEKTQKVIPNKAFEIIAMKKPLITSYTPAINEFFTNEKNCILCKVADEKEIAKSIIKLKDNLKLRESISLEGYNLFSKKGSYKKIGKALKEELNKLY
jgi:glycosyltransferase involved in cell wall biosynthesis